MKSKLALEDAKKVFPGGVNSPVRAFASVGNRPPFIERAKGSKIFDIDGNEYIDYVGSWGPMILGHTDDDVADAIRHVLSKGFSFGAPTLAETRLAKLIQIAFPNIEVMRFVNSGTEATMSAIRVARGYSNRPLIVKCDGGYHGHGDSMLVSAGSGAATLGIPGSQGVPEAIASNTIIVPFNDANALEECFKKYSEQIAAIILEPVSGNMGVVLPKSGYLQSVRKLCDKYGVILIFDEVMTGFRACFGGVSKVEGVEPDMTCLGKIVGGGMPLAVYGGKESIMRSVAPDGGVYQAGTLSGNPLAVAAGIATLSKIKDTPDFYKSLINKAEKLEVGFKTALSELNLNFTMNRFGSMSTLFFNENIVYNYDDAKKCNTDMFAKWFSNMLSEGIYLAPSQFEAAFISWSHSDDDIERTIAAAKKSLSRLSDS